MKPCKSCGKEIDDRYQYCIDCIKKIKEGNQNEDISSILTKINWNLGMLVKYKKLEIAYTILNYHGENREKLQQKIADFVIKNIEKEISIIKEIKKEIEKNENNQ